MAAPIKIDIATDEMVSHAAHFLGKSKKDVVDEAVREYVDKHRTAIQEGALTALKSLNGSLPSAVSLITGMTHKELDELGGF